MLDVILNESEIVDNFIKTHEIPKDIKPTHMIFLLTKKFFRLEYYTITDINNYIRRKEIFL